MVWINNEHYNAKSYPPEAYGGAMCTCPVCQEKYWRIKTRIPGELLKRRLKLEEYKPVSNTWKEIENE